MNNCVAPYASLNAMSVDALLLIMLIFPAQGMSFTNTSPLVVPTRGKEVGETHREGF